MKLRRFAEAHNQQAFDGTCYAKELEQRICHQRAGGTRYRLNKFNVGLATLSIDLNDRTPQKESNHQ
ncbi:hypothetical protein RSSM_01438 [Rhodopirellula sallentina SM41]|uniref:Uncharacterized protein n=1 Tax=Rhodopirellula sallentina SM41 TaxID=1263870 RepID=M5U6L4_9BACT|nr:hypothetical protein RSSM_01438 [Rhodopirellula sallentina SM41]